jgi:hypothetical protein
VSTTPPAPSLGASDEAALTASVATGRRLGRDCLERGSLAVHSGGQDVLGRRSTRRRMQLVGGKHGIGRHAAERWSLPFHAGTGGAEPPPLAVVGWRRLMAVGGLEAVSVSPR